MNPEDDKTYLKAISTLRDRQASAVRELKYQLHQWITQHQGDTDYEKNYAASLSVEVSIALLETAIDRHIALHDTADARQLVLACFDRRAKQIGH